MVLNNGILYDSGIFTVQDIVNSNPDYTYSQDEKFFDISYRGKKIIEVEVDESPTSIDKVNVKYVGTEDELNIHKEIIDELLSLGMP